MAHHVEPMDIESDFDNKENSLRHNNVLPFTEKGYEELDVSELNMKLRYSVTPASSPMSKSYTANCVDNRSLESGDDSLNITISENVNLTRSLNSAMTNNDNVVKSLKALPLQAIPTDQFVDSNRNTSVLRPLDSTVIPEHGNITVTVSAPSDIEENLSILSSSSSAIQTPEATTPTKDIPPKDGGSPIMRGLKSVLSMFRSSQSPIPPVDQETVTKPDILNPLEEQIVTDSKPQQVLASTPISAHRKKEMSPTKRSSPSKDNSIVFNEDLEKELQWKDETTIIFSQERIPIHKLMLQQPLDIKNLNNEVNMSVQNIQDLNSTVEYMDISYNDSIKERTLTDVQTDNKQGDNTFTAESDSEFLDCETTFTKDESQVIEDVDKTPIVDNMQDLDITKNIEIKNESGSRLKQIILDTTQDILDATLSIRPEDLLPEEDKSLIVERTENVGIQKKIIETETISRKYSITQVDQPIIKETANITSPVIFETRVDDTNLNVNKILDTTLTTQLVDQTFDVSTVEYDRENMNDTKTEENLLGVTQILEDKLVLTENQNTTLTNETITHNTNTFDTEAIPATDNIDGNTTIAKQDTDLDKTNHVDSITNDEIPVAPNVIPVLQEVVHESLPIPNDFEIDNLKEVHESLPIPNDFEIDNLKEVHEALPIPNDFGIDNLKEASMIELPVDIPLPDEDDLDKELNIDTTNEINAPISLPLDLVDNIKTTNEIPEIIYNVPSVELEVTLIEKSNEVEKVFLGEECNSVKEESSSIPALETGNDDVNCQSIVLNPIEAIKEVENIHEEIHDKNAMPEVNQMTENVDINNSLSYTILGNEFETTVDINEINNEINEIDNLDVKKILKNIELEIQNQGVIPFDMSESISEYKPLPDIINQTIAISDLESAVSVPLTTAPEVPEPKIDENAYSNDLQNKTDDNDEIKLQINTNQPTIDSIKAIEELPNATTAAMQHSIASEGIVINKIKSLEKLDDIEVKEENAIPSEIVLTPKENVSADIEAKNEITESANTKGTEEELILSENNSPFVCVTADNIPEIKPEGTMKVVFTPPASPPIRSKGYNFNFDDIDCDPFTTKTNIRMSPPLPSPNKSTEGKEVKTVEKPIPRKDVNRRKSQPERKRPTAPKRKFNSTFDTTTNDKVIDESAENLKVEVVKDIKIDSPAPIALNPNNVTIEEVKSTEIVDNPSNDINMNNDILETKSEIILQDNFEEISETTAKICDSNIELHLNELKTTSSSEQSTYFSAGTSSSESSIPSKNVFNLPEIDDINFNPFATKSKMRQSPPPGLDDPFASKSKIKSSPDTSFTMQQKDAEILTTPEDKIETESMEKDALSNLSNTTASSKATDERNVTSREIHTEDEDTMEGPFFEGDNSNIDDKMSDFDGENIDMLQFNELPTQNNEDNLDNGELFIDAEAFEFLLNQNKSNMVVDSGKESLFLKFDPLFAKRMSAVTSDGVVASLAKLQKQSTPTKATQTPPKNMPSPVPGPSNFNVTQDVDMNNSEELTDDLNATTVSKPMMVVPPAINPVTPRNKSLTPNRSNRRSITFTSPAMAVIDRLLSLSANNSVAHDTTVTHVSREQNEADRALSQLRELLAEKEINVYNLRSESNELRERLNTLESHMKTLENESQDRLQKINQLNDTLAEKTKINRSMAAVVEEYERTIASLIAETAQDKKKHAEERIKLINERDEQTAHLASMEVSFSDLHSKYEKSKQVILNCKANEDTYKKSIKEFEENFTKMQNNYELLKQHATSKLNHANQEMEKINRTHEAEVLKLNAMIKRKELHITSLEESLVQKTKANEELTAICDELINKVG